MFLARPLLAIWLIGLAFVRPGVAGLLTVMAVELAIIISMSLYNPTSPAPVDSNRLLSPHAPRSSGTSSQ